MDPLKKSAAVEFHEYELLAESSQASPANITTCGFPSTFNFYCETSFKRCPFYIGEDKSKKLYAVSLHSGFRSKPDLVLHNGPQNEHQPLATVKNNGMFSRHATVNITPSSPSSGLANVQEDLRFHMGMTTTCTFSIPIEHGGKTYAEKFEWRSSHGGEVKALSGWPLGLKLVRLDRETVEESGGKRKDRDIGASSDGKEVVAVWAFQAKPSLHKIGKFRFLGSGATGELGECFAIMAVISVLRLWQIDYAMAVVATTAASAS